jgi:hypothetical protein
MSLFFSTGVIAASGLGAAAPGMVLMKPTSIANSGGSATLGANGQVTFSAVTSVSLNGCFTADFDNYFVMLRHKPSTATGYTMRLRASGTDASGSNYNTQYLYAYGSTVEGFRYTNRAQWDWAYTESTYYSGDPINFYGPFLAQPTAASIRGVTTRSTASMENNIAWTHSLSTSYDGFTITAGGGSVTGELTIYGIRS